MQFRSACRTLIAALALSASLQAGRNFLAKPGEQTKPNELIVRLRPGGNIAAAIASAAPGASSNAIHAFLNLHRVVVPPGLADRIAALLAALPDVDYVEPNRVRRTDLAAPNDPNYSNQWGLAAVNAFEAWSLLPAQYLTAAGASGQRVKVAVLDSGVDCTHADFVNVGGTSADAALGGQLALSLSRAFVASTVSSPVCTVMDDNGHGTHVAGTIAAATQNGAGVSSVAWPVAVVSYKVLDKTGSGSDSVIAQAITAAADAGIPVVSMSLGGAGYSQALQDAINYAWARNTLVICAAGNGSTSALTFPAAANHAIGVSATDSFGNVASFSNFGPSVDVAGPGVNILSTAPSYSGTQLGILNYASLSGTSMATPHVSAVAALIAMATPGAPAAAIAQRLQQSAVSRDASGGWGQFVGYGVVNALRAVTGSLRPSTTGGITGQVVDAGGFPVGGATVAAGGTSMTTASDGLFRLTGLAPATYQLSVAAAGFPGLLLSAAVPPGADAPITPQLGKSVGTFSGAVTDRGVGVPGAVVQALAGGVAQATATTDAAGNYSLPVAPGTYDIRGGALGAGSATVAARTVGSGGTTAVSISISRLGTISGVVKNANSNPVAGATITLTGPESAGATTDSNGAFQTIGLVAGAYSVTATAFGQPTTTVTGMVVTADTATPVTIVMGGAPPPPPPAFSPIRVNAGGPAYTDGAGIAWSADTGFTAGNTWGVTQPISNTSTPTLYQTCRWGSFGYQFTVPNGPYTVNLKFAEVSMTGPGQRMFNVAINGATVLFNFDIFAQAGGALMALDKPFSVNVTGGQISIQFSPGSIQAPMVNAIEILSANGGGTSGVTVAVNPPNATVSAGGTQQFGASVTGSSNTAVTWSVPQGIGSISTTGLYIAPPSVSAQQTVTVVATSVADPSKSGSATVTVNPASTFTPIRVNTGGPAYTDSLGQAWSADTGYAGGFVWSVTGSVVNTSDPALYQNVRYGHGFSYQFAVPNGGYHVKLKFAEVSMTGPQQRMFDVSINGQRVLLNLDIYAESGGAMIALDKVFPVVVTGGQIAIQFSDGSVNAPMVNAIEIVP
ncbi:MAG TPA: malectin domain-containing carbohydrate-binding protein [Bryobacteraceae bacterium]|jgi:subtilisin family serine protease